MVGQPTSPRAPSDEDVRHFKHELEMIRHALFRSDTDNRWDIGLSGKARVIADELGLNSHQRLFPIGIPPSAAWRRIIVALETPGNMHIRICTQIDVLIDWLESLLTEMGSELSADDAVKGEQ